MKPEHLEWLLLDRALGELPPPVAELLDEHLARDAQAAEQAGALGATLQHARRSLAGPALAAPRPWAATPLRQAARRQRWWAHLGGAAKLAACLVLGLLLGRALAPEPAAVRPLAAVATLTPAGQPVSSPRFWSLAGRRQLQAVRPDRRGLDYQLRWESPLKMPRVEEKP